MIRDGVGFGRVIVCYGRVDLRKGIDGLAAYARLHGVDPYEKGSLILFCGRRGDRIKGLCFEGDGVTMVYKRLSAGNRFQWPRTSDEAREISPEQYRMLMGGFPIVGSIMDPREDGGRQS